jgi:RNA polymerase sigma factor (sigma-70 family)
MREITREDVEYVKRVVLSLPVSYMLGVDDAVGEGLVGLCKAARSFDGRGRFLGYAHRWIVGEVLESARRADHLTRNHRQRIKCGDVEDVPPAVYLEDLIPRIGGGRTSLAGGYRSWEGIFGCEEEDIALRLVLDEAVCSIAGRTGTALRLYVLHDLSQVEIGEILGVTESRVSQLIRAARCELREALGAMSAADLLAA